jgi:Gpi18-like mannosyltransferase
LLVGVAIRLAFSPYTYSSFDVLNWFKLSTTLPGLGLTNIYAPGSPLYRYPPIWAYILYGIGLIAPKTPNFTFLLLVKTPIILADILAYLILIRIIFDVTNNSRKALIGGALWILNPFVIFVTSLWAMFDSICALFIILAVYLLIIKNCLYLSGIALGLALATKQYAFIPYITLLTYTACSQGKTKFLKILVASVITFTILSLPSLYNPIIARLYLKALLYTSPTTVFDPRYNYSMWINILPLFQLGYISEVNLNYAIYYVFYASIAVPSLYYLVRRLRQKPIPWGINPLLNAALISMLIFTILSPQVYSNYFVVPISLLIPSIVLKPNQPTRLLLLGAYVALAITHIPPTHPIVYTARYHFIPFVHALALLRIKRLDD